MWNAIQCSGMMTYYQNRVINDNNHIQDFEIKIDRCKSTQDSITESLDYSRSVFDELAQSTRNASNYLLESSVKDASKNCEDAKKYLEQLKSEGAPASEINAAEENYKFASSVFNQKNQELANAKNNTETLLQTSKTLTNQYFDKQKDAQLKNAQKLEKQYTTKRASWQKRLTIDQAAYDGYEKGFNDSASKEFTPQFTKG